MKQRYFPTLFLLLLATANLFAQGYAAGDTIGTFENGYYIIKCPSGYLSLYSDEGNIVLPCRFFAIGETKRYRATSGYFWAQTENDYWGDGPLFPSQEEEDLSYVPWEEFDKGQWQLYDKNGELALKDTFQYPFDIAAGYGIAKLLNGKEGVMASELNWLIPPVYDHVAYMENERGYGDTGDGFALGNYIDSDSIRFLHPYFTLPANNGKSMVYGMADGDGKLVVPLQYDAVGKPYNGLIPLMKGYELGYYDLEGHLLLAPAKNNFLRTDIVLVAKHLSDYRILWEDEDTAVLNSITSAKVSVLANNLMLRHQMLRFMHSSAHSLFYARLAYNYPNIAHEYYLPFPLWEGPWGVYCSTGYYYDARPVGATPVSISFQTVYKICEDCTKIIVPDCDHVAAYHNYFITKSGVEEKRFKEVFNIPDADLNVLMRQSLAMYYPMSCMDTSQLYLHANDVAVFNQTGVDFYIDPKDLFTAEECTQLYDQLEGIGDLPYPYIKISVPYSKLKSYFIKGSEVGGILK